METNSLEEEFDSANGEDLTAESPDDSKLVKHLRAELKKRGAGYDELASQVESIKRESVLSKAGLELNEVQRRALEAAHDGDFTADEIKKTAAALGFIKNPDLEISDAEATQLDNAASASQGSAAPGTPADEFQAALSGAKSQKEVMEALVKSGWAGSKAATWGSQS